MLGDLGNMLGKREEGRRHAILTRFLNLQIHANSESSATLDNNSMC